MNVYNRLCPRPLDTPARPEKEGSESTDHLLMHEYGPPRYGMSDSAWTAFLLSRRNVEDTLITLEIDIPCSSE